MTFRARMIIVTTFAVALAMVGATSAMYVVVRDQMRGGIDESLHNRADFAKATYHEDSNRRGGPGPVAPGGASGTFQLVDAAGAAVRPQPPPRPPGSRQRDFRQPPRIPRKLQQEIDRVSHANLRIDHRTALVAKGTHRAFLSEQRVDGVHFRIYTFRLANGLAAQVARPMDEVDTSLSRIAKVLAVVDVLGTFVAFLLALLVTRTMLAPVRTLAGAIDDVTTSTDLTRRIEAHGNDELGQLAARFNQMMAALEASDAAQRQLVDDASHELRTPLTSLRTNMDVLVSAGDKLSSEARAALLRDLSIQVDELAHLVNDVVELAKGATPETEFRSLRLDELVASCVERMQRMAPSAVFELDIEPVLLHGSDERLQRAIANLLVNAVNWNAPAEPVHVSCSASGVSVRDHGPGVANEDKPHLFDRFYRAADARDMPGSGLGLAIAMQVAEEHRGTIEVHDAEGGGALFVLRLPGVPAAATADPVVA